MASTRRGYDEQPTPCALKQVHIDRDKVPHDECSVLLEMNFQVKYAEDEHEGILDAVKGGSVLG